MWEWIKRNKFLLLVLVIVFYFFLNLSSTFFGIDTLSIDVPSSGGNLTDTSGGINLSPGGSFGASNPALPSRRSANEYTPQTTTNDRLVVQESNLSLLVKDVISVRDNILEHASSAGGYMVSSQTSNPGEAPNATVVVRVPSDKLSSTLEYFHSLSIKVVSENLRGYDVTDQYTDIEARIAQVERTKSQIEGLLDRATQISEITNLTQQVLNYQNQIDSLKGQQIALEQNAKLAKLTIYLSTDEIALPYAPNETFRPLTTFKLAIRSLMKTLAGIGVLVIWLTVYAIVWVPAVLIIRYLRNRNRKNTEANLTSQVKK